ncbi:M20/M25/M40 family metallo-hydrolase [Microbacterium esteraromaticum]|uniref:M20/M25/M40 family metallo-hydrolase n=1 Tax=Microbacterium esteraromaticum TaxID=57043 RepID=A0A7D8A9P6_9MICO|nr:M20/M25/M40 family metallo-hydrolase [Microbacterium esteraromaticum]QMU97680.1 M20/M25/M40 family metallo-hydrolase [Microbacterium esteraromaticum]
MTPAELCAHFIQFDTSNFGSGESTGETPLAEEIARLLRDAGYSPELYAREPHRASTVIRVPGTDRSLPGMVVHGHLDVVPAEPEQWSVPPFEGRISDGYIYGRGAVDMKDMVAMMVATLLEWASLGISPQRDIVFAFVADEEARGDWGAGWLVETHPELFAGIGASIGESGGHATPLTAADGGTVMLYPIAVAERGTLHAHLRAEGTSGHGSRPCPDSAVTKLLAATNRINTHQWPLELGDTVREYITSTNAALGYQVDLGSEAGVTEAIDRMGEAGEVARVTSRCSSTTTVLRAGYKVNVVPGVAEAEVDVRCVPGSFESTRAALAELIGPDVAFTITDPGEPTDFSSGSPWFAAMREAVLRHDPDGVVVPYCMGGGTDSKSFRKLGIECFGFVPLTADPEGRRLAGLHGIDERVPVASVNGGQRILSDFLLNL